MKTRILTQLKISAFGTYLREEEKSAATIEKYLRDVEAFNRYTGDREVTREQVIAYKNGLVERGYAVSSVNSILASINSMLNFLGWADCKTRNLRQQRKTYCPEAQELTKEEYRRLLSASEGNPQLHLLIQTICATGIRVSELRYFTKEAVKRGEVTVSCKSKTRTILIPGQLRRLLLRFAEKRKIQNGPVFITRNGLPLNRSNIWAQMKRLCIAANVAASKVFPHNLRKLFARTFYSEEKDIAKLADILGHSSINTTRIYIMTTGAEHLRKIEGLGLVMQV